MRALPLICLIICAIVALAIAPANAELFNCKDENGRRVIQNMPCDGPRVTEPVPQPRADPLRDAAAAYQRGDYAQAFRLWRRAAEVGNAQAQYNLGAMYANGDGVTRDDQEAAKWWRLAAAQGHALAQTNLSALNERAQAGRDLLAQPAAGLLTDVPPVLTPSTVPETVASQTAPDPLAPPDPFAPPQTASHRAGPLDRAAVGAISGAALGALVGLFILARALVEKFKAPAAAGAMKIYRNRPQAIKLGAALLLGCAALLLYFLYFKTNTVDDYLNNYQGRLEKLQECGQVPDMTKDKECMNAYTAQRMFVLGRMPPQ